MLLWLHLFIHVVFAVLAGLIVWKFCGQKIISFAAAFAGGVLIDLDHLIDHFAAFGFSFDFFSFIQGEHFAVNDKIYVLFHGWEYVILLIVVVWLIKSNIKLKTAILALAVGAFFHLLVDVNINHGMTYTGYSVIYRAVNGYKMEKIVTPKHYIDHLSKKREHSFDE